MSKSWKRPLLHFELAVGNRVLKNNNQAVLSIATRVRHPIILVW